MATTSADLLSIQLNINGAQNSAMVSKIEVFKGINKISKASVTLQDGSKSKEDFKLSDSDDFIPGNQIEIKAGYHSKEETIFKGIIMSQSIVIDPYAGPSLLIECKDEVVASTKARKNAYFLNSSDSDIINKILGNYSFSKDVDSTSAKHEEIIQYDATDWDFIISRAEINGLVAVNDDGKLSIKKPSVSDQPAVTLSYGDDIVEMNLSVGSEDQLSQVSATSWSSENQAVVSGKSQEPTINEEGSLTGKKLAGVLNANELLQSPVPLEKDVLDTWAEAQLLKSRLSRFQGTILCTGSAAVKPNSLIKIEGVGKKINGNCYISTVHHELEEGHWFTEAGIGLQKEWFAENNDISPLKSGGRIPSLNGLHIGVVKKIDSDPANEFRVQVTLPLIESSDDGIWARLSTFYASNGFGAFFYPEIGDEVILGFLDDNPSAPIILGSVYSKANAPSLTPDEKNTHKAIVTQTKMTLDFDEENKVITIQTPGNNVITISDQDKGITLTDQNNNSIQLNDSGITIDSKKDITIKAANNLTVSATNIDIKAQSNLNLTGNNTNIKANMALSAQGSASAELKASGNVTIKGAMVSIN